ncbi:MAG: hypothetical protein WC869_16020, partial [Phycisphaerae bacterium]
MLTLVTDSDMPIPTSTAIMEMVKKLKHGVQPETLHAYLESVIIRRVDAEREDLAKLGLELDVDPREPLVLAGARSGGPAGAALAAVTVMKRRFSRLCRERLQGEDCGGLVKPKKTSDKCPL